jgi:hypothetical protein
VPFSLKAAVIILTSGAGVLARSTHASTQGRAVWPQFTPGEVKSRIGPDGNIDMFMGQTGEIASGSSCHSWKNFCAIKDTWNVPNTRRCVAGRSHVIIFALKNIDVRSVIYRGPKSSYPRGCVTQLCAPIIMNDCIRQTICSSPISLSKIFVVPSTSAPVLVFKTAMGVCTFRRLMEQRAVIRFLTLKGLYASQQLWNSTAVHCKELSCFPMAFLHVPRCPRDRLLK